MPKVTRARKAKEKSPARRAAGRLGGGGGARRKPAPGGFTGALARVKRLVEEYAFASIAGALVLIVVAGIVFWAGGYGAVLASAVDDLGRSAARASGLRVEKITLKGAHDLSHEELLAVVGSTMMTSLPHVDLEGVRQDVEALGWVRHAAVARLYPDTLHISVRERSPIAVWRVANEARLIDDDGAIIRAVRDYEYPHLPMLLGDGAATAASEILAALGATPDFAKSVGWIRRVGDRRWNLVLRNEAQILLPEEGVRDAVELVWEMQQKEAVLDQALEYIDLRDGERVIVRRKMDADPSSE